MPKRVSGDIEVGLERAMKKFAKNMGKKRNIYFQPFADEESTCLSQVAQIKWKLR